MSVHEVDVKSHGPIHLQMAIDLIMIDEDGEKDIRRPNKVSHWAVIDGALIFGWHANLKDSIPLPAELGRKQLIDMITAWLANQNYPPKPPFDGDSVAGYHIYRERLGYGTLVVKPYWMHYGK